MRFLFLFIACLLCVIQPISAQTANVTPLLPEPLINWYRGQSDVEPDSSYFGAYVMIAAEDMLYLGISTSVPVHDNGGAVVARYDDTGLTLIPGYREQDINRMKMFGDRILIPGYDPTQGWDAGNLYILDRNQDMLRMLRYRYDSPHFVGVTTTDANGNYLFEGLEETSYIVRFLPPAGWGFTQPGVGDNGYSDSNPNVEGRDTTCTTEQHAPLFQSFSSYESTIDAGLIQDNSAPVQEMYDGAQDDTFFDGGLTLGDLVWHDRNGNGLQDEGEPGVGDVRVELYTRDPYFPCIIHSSGIWGDPETGEVYYNGGTLSGGNVTFRSLDGGENWEYVSEDLLYYWASDFIRFRDTFYKLHRAYGLGASPAIAYSQNGQEWSTFTGDNAVTEPILIPRLNASVSPFAIDDTNAFVVFQDQLIVLHPNGDRLYTITDAGEYETVLVEGVNFSDILPDFIDPDYRWAREPNRVLGLTNHYNVLANANDEFLYVIGSDNAVYVTSNLRSWQQVADFDVIGRGAPVIALTYWAERDIIVAATAGEQGNLYAIPVTRD